MNKYRITLSIMAGIDVEVCADSEEEAERMAYRSDIDTFELEDAEIQNIEGIELIERGEEPPELPVDLEALGQIPIFQT